MSLGGEGRACWVKITLPGQAKGTVIPPNQKIYKQNGVTNYGKV